VNLRGIKSLAKAVGATVEYDRGFGHNELRVEAPHGHVWKCADIHELVDSSRQPWTPDFDDVAQRMNYGVAKCETPNCEWCSQ
jgi:hypothetical protein